MRENVYAECDIAYITSRALIKAVEEHGAPNSFTPGELTMHYMGGAYIRPASIGRRFIVQWIKTDLALLGWRVDYKDRRFFIAERDD